VEEGRQSVGEGGRWYRTQSRKTGKREVGGGHMGGKGEDNLVRERRVGKVI